VDKPASKIDFQKNTSALWINNDGILKDQKLYTLVRL